MALFGGASFFILMLFALFGFDVLGFSYIRAQINIYTAGIIGLAWVAPGYLLVKLSEKLKEKEEKNAQNN
ncbi:MAG: hypothetical protein LRZ85_06270 [Alphaproteobacteria bacterium]|nr:hypothetical protein [Alphaproteobacteria bacterium]